MDTYQQRRLEAALIRTGKATSWREYLADQRRLKVPAARVVAEVVGLGVTVDTRTLQRWTRQAVHQVEARARTRKKTPA